MMILDRHYRIVRINRASADRLGVDPEDVVGRTCYELMHGLSEPPAGCPHSRLLADGKQHEADVSYSKLDGTFHVSASPILDAEGNLVGGVHVPRAITER